MSIATTFANIDMSLQSMPCLLGLQRYTKNFWEKTPVVKVDSLPFDINGEAVYQVPYQKDKRMKAVTDGRPWDRDMPRTARRSGKGLSTRSVL